MQVATLAFKTAAWEMLPRRYISARPHLWDAPKENKLFIEACNQKGVIWRMVYLPNNYQRPSGNPYSDVNKLWEVLQKWKKKLQEHLAYMHEFGETSRTQICYIDLCISYIELNYLLGSCSMWVKGRYAPYTQCWK